MNTKTEKGPKPGDPHAPEIEDEDDELESSRAPLMDHLVELRKRLIRSILAIVLGAIVCYFFARPIYNFLLQPLVDVAQLEEGRTDFRLIYTEPLEVFFAELKLSLFGGFLASFPIVIWQVYAFIAPGLYKREKQTVLPFMLSSPVLFTLGAVFVYYLMLPFIARFSLGYAQLGGEGIAAIEPQIKVAGYLSLVMALIIAFGLSFQLPVVLALMGRAGIVGADTLRKGRKYAVVGILAFAAVFTPPDPVSQVMLAVPVYLLYEISIFVVAAMEKKREEEEEAEEA